jgi:hypothetical protein
VDFEQVLKEVVWRLVTEGRISYRRIKLSFALDDDGLEELSSRPSERSGKQSIGQEIRAMPRLSRASGI